MGITSVIKRIFLWWAAFMVFLNVHTEGCNKNVFIVDFNSTFVNLTDSNHSMHDIKESNWTLPQTRSLWFVNAPTKENCSIEICNQISNVTKLKDGYEIILKGEVGIYLQFLLYANSSLDSNYHLKGFQNVSVENVCASAQPLNQCPYSGNNASILYVHQNGSMNCLRCSPQRASDQRNFSISTNGKTFTSAALELMNNLSSLVQRMGSNSRASITMGMATGLIQKQDEEADVSLRMNQQMVWEQVDVLQASESMWSVKVPAEAITMSHSKDNGTPFVGVLLFPGLSENVSKGLTFASEIFGIAMGVKITNLTDTIDICFKKISKNGGNMTCISSDHLVEQVTKDTQRYALWLMSVGWTLRGMRSQMIVSYMEAANGVVQPTESEPIFKGRFQIIMNHFGIKTSIDTSFSMQPASVLSEPGTNISYTDKITLTYITSIGCGLSTFFLLVGLFIHFVMWRSKARLGTTILMNLFVALVLLNITFLSNQQVWSQHNMGCTIIAAAMHFSMLATFTWFFIHGLHFYLILNAVDVKNRKYKLSFIGSGWGFPAVAVIVIASSGNYTNVDYVEMCWITNKYIHYIVNVGYYSVIFIFTSIIFIMIIRKIIQAKQSTIKTYSKKTGAILGLFFLLGLTWGLAFFSYGPLTVPSYYIFTIFNSFQGFFLFIYYYYFRNDEPEIRQSASIDAPSLRKPANSSSTETSGPDTVTEYN